MRLSDFSVLTFDCYGTLIDWETGIWNALAPWLERQGVSLARDQLLEAFSELESAQQTATPGLRYPELLAAVHRGLAERFGGAFPEAYKEDVSPWVAAGDAVSADAVDRGSDLRMNLYRPRRPRGGILRLKLFRKHQPIPLSEIKRKSAIGQDLDKIDAAIAATLGRSR